MNNFIILSKTLLINSFRPITSNKKNYLKYLVLLAFFPMIFGIYSLVSRLYPIFKEIGQEGLILGIGFSFVSMAIFYIGIFVMLSVFYYSSDLEKLLYMPFSPSALLSSKFLVTLVYEYITEAALLIPMIIAYGTNSNSNILFYLYVLVIFLAIPIIPLVLACIINMVIMRFTNILKNKDRFRTIGGLFSIFIAIGINFYIQKISVNRTSPEEIAELFTKGDNSLLNITSNLFPSIQFAVKSIINSNSINGLLYLLIFLLINIIFITIFNLIGEKIYFKGVIGISESSTNKVKISSNVLDKYSVRHSSLTTFTLKELKIIFRTPAYFMNCVIINFLWPIFIFLPFIFDDSLITKLNEITLLISSGIFDGIIIAIAFSLGTFMASANGITSSSISRDGKNFYLNKFLAINYNTQIIAKILCGVLLSSISSLLILLIAFITLDFNLYLLLSCIFFLLIGILISSMVGIIIDIISPKLVWDNEQKAVKQNLNILIHTVIGLALAYGGIILVQKFKLNFIYTMLTMGLGSILIFGILYLFLSTKGVKMYQNIDI